MATTIAMPPKASLDRLKGLNTLPDLASQLEEARILCTHSARADMILKFLLQKLRDDSEARNSPESWKLLGTTFRLLPLERLALLLGSADLLGTVRTSLEEVTAGAEVALLGAIADAVNLLLGLARRARGAPLKAILSADATIAASFTGAWISAVYRAIFTSDIVYTDGRRLVEENCLLDPAIQIWNLRKQREDEDEAFAAACLAPAAYILDALSSPQKGNSSSGKRKRHGGRPPSMVVGYVKALEAMIAKHIFLPARTAFFTPSAAGTGASTANGTVDGDSPPRPDLHRRLVHFKTAEIGDDESESVEKYQRTLPLLLDIALRCVPAASPKQRTKEVPWVEAVFTGLLDCAVWPPQSLLVELLSVVGRHASLSRPFLTKLVGTYVKGGDVSRLGSWELIAEVIKLDPDVYTTPTMAKRLFEDLSKANLKIEPGGPASDPAYGTTLLEVWKEEIVVPVMRAFARGRGLLTFVDLWHEQLHKSLNGVERCVWLALDQAFGALVEPNLTERQIHDSIARFHKSITAGLGEQCFASVVVLNGFLSGLHRFELVDNLTLELGELFDVMISLFEEDPILAAECPQIWASCRRCFELWFPSWAVVQTDRDALVDRTLRIVDCSALQQAEDFVTALRYEAAAVPAKTKAAQEAALFITSISNTLQQYDERATALDRTSLIAEHFPASELAVLLRLPNVLGDLGDSVFNNALHGWIGEAVELGYRGEDPSAVLEGLKAVIATAVSQAQEAVIEDVVRVGLTYLKRDSDEFDDAHVAAKVAVGLRVLAELPATSLNTLPRERMLDGVAGLEHSQGSGQANKGQELWRGRLVVMLRMLELPSPGANMCKDTSVIWKLGNPAYTLDKLKAGRLPLSPMAVTDDEPKNVELLEELVGVMLKHAMAVQRRQGQHDGGGTGDGTTLLADVSSEVNQHIRLLCKDGETFSGNDRTLGLLKVVLAVLDKNDQLGLRQGGFDQVCNQQYARCLLRTARELCEPQPISEQRRLPMVLGALLEIPRSVNQDGTFAEELTSLVQYVLEVRFATFLAGEDDQIMQIAKVTLVHCVQLICSWPLRIDDGVLANVMIRALDSGLQPREHAALLSALHDGCSTGGRFGAQSRVGFVERFLPREEELAVSASKLRLVDVVTKSLGREDFDDAARTPQDILHTLLHGAKETQDSATRHRACECIATVLREKPWMTNQYTIESTVSALYGLLSKSNADGRVFMDVCKIFTLLLQQYRSRLKDRSNLVVGLLQALVNLLLGVRTSSTTQARESRSEKGLTARHAKVLARLLQLVCKPPVVRTQSAKGSDLIDSARKAQAAVGEWAQFVLHSYCQAVLTGTPAEGVREELKLGVWAMIETMEVNDQDSIKVLRYAMADGERNVLNGEYQVYLAEGKARSG